jgi:hypothetical protein
MVLVLLLCTSTDLFEFWCTVLFLHTTLKGSSVHTYMLTANQLEYRSFEHGWMKKTMYSSKGSRVTQLNGYVLNAHPFSNSAIAFLDFCAKLKPPGRC